MNRIIKYALGGSLIVVLIGRLGIILLSDLNFLITTVSDDSFYYLKVAQNIANGSGSTFDQLNSTNGYHPLWMAIEVVLAKVISGKEMLLRTSLFLQLIFWLAGLRLIYISYASAENKDYSIAGLAAIVPLFYPRYISVLLSGLESALTFFLVVVFLRWFRLISFNTHLTIKAFAKFSLLLSLIFLSRLDSVFVIMTAVGYLSLIIIYSDQQSRAFRIKSIFALGLPLLIVISAYLLFNITNFGHLLPISGSLKTTFPEARLNLSYLISYPEWLIVSFLVVVVYTAFWRSNDADNPLALPMLVFGFGLLGHTLFTILFMNWAVFSWHFILVLPGLAFMAGDSVSWFSKWLSSAKPSIQNSARIKSIFPLSSIAIAIGLLAGQFYALATPDMWHQASYQAALAVRDRFPSDSVLAMKDSGVFGYFSERSVINLDGVINSYEYQEYLSRGEINTFLCSLNVRYVAQHRLGTALSKNSSTLYYDQYSLELPSRLLGGLSEIEFFPDAEVYRKEYAPKNFPTVSNDGEVEDELFVIWEIQPCDG